MSVTICIYELGENYPTEHLYSYFMNKNNKQKLRSLGLKEVNGTIQPDGFVFNGKQILWRQGWFFKSRFFNRKDTSFYGVNSKQVRNFMNKYIDVFSHDPRGLEAYNAVMKTYKDGMIFECAF